MFIEDISDTLNNLSQLNFDGWKEIDVREEFIKPLLNCLGYFKNSDYDINREDEHLLNKPFLMIGRKKIQIDYKLLVRKKQLWIIEAKSAENKTITTEDIFQAYYYSIHPEVKAFYFIVTNGWLINLYDVKSLDEYFTPVLSFETTTLKNNFSELYKYIGARNIINKLKQNVLDDISTIFSTEINESSLKDFSIEVNNILNQIKPIIKSNKKRVLSEKEFIEIENLKKTFREYKIENFITILLRYPQNLFYFNTVYNLFKEKFESIDDNNKTLIILKIFQVFLGRPMNNHRRNLITLLIYLYKDFGIKYDNIDKRILIENFIRDSINYSTSQFKDYPLWIELDRLEGNLFRLLYKSTFCIETIGKLLKESVFLKNKILPEEDVLYQRPHIARERIDFVETSVEIFYIKFSHHDISDLIKINNELEQIENAIEEEFITEFIKIKSSNEADISFYESYNKPFDYLNSGIYSILVSSYNSIYHLLDDIIINNTKSLVSKIGKNYNVNYADILLIKYLLQNNKYIVSDSFSKLDISSTIINLLSHGHIQREYNKDNEYKIWGRYDDEGNYINIYFELSNDYNNLIFIKYEFSK